MFVQANDRRQEVMRRPPLYGSVLLALFVLLRQEILPPRNPALNVDDSPSRRP